MPSRWFSLLLGIFLFGTAQSQTLNLQEFVRLTLANNPQMRSANAAVAGAQAVHTVSRSRLLPQVEGKVDAGVSGPSSTVPGAAATPSTQAYSAGLTASELLFDAGKSYSLDKASSRLLDAAREDRKTTIQDLILQARTDYFDFLLAREVLSVNKQTLQQAKEHLDLAKTLVTVGKQASYTITKAEVDIANAQVNVDTAENNVKLTLVQMENTAGKEFPDDLVLTDSLNMPEEQIPYDRAVKDATENNPQVLSTVAKEEAARLQMIAARRAFFPELDASGGYEYQKIGTADWQNDWNAGVSLNVPLYLGGAISGAYDQAAASYAQAQADLQTLKLQITLQVQQNYLSVQEASQLIESTDIAVKDATEGLTLSQERFANGLAASLEVTDAQTTLATAEIAHVQAIFRYRLAHANLLNAMGELE